MNQPYDVRARIESPAVVLGAALDLWQVRDDAKPQPEVRKAANKAMDAIDAMLASLHAMRSRSPARSARATMRPCAVPGNCSPVPGRGMRRPLSLEANLPHQLHIVNISLRKVCRSHARHRPRTSVPGNRFDACTRGTVVGRADRGGNRAPGGRLA